MSRRALTEQLRARNAELAPPSRSCSRPSPSATNASASRRELHDIVARTACRVMVVQASAGQRVAGADRGGAAEAFAAVAEAAAQAQAEIGRLVELLSGDPQTGGIAAGCGWWMSWSGRPSATGLAVTCRFRGR